MAAIQLRLLLRLPHNRRLSEKSSMAWPASGHLQGLFTV
jgi:hypothetical protein